MFTLTIAATFVFVLLVLALLLAEEHWFNTTHYENDAKQMFGTDIL